MKNPFSFVKGLIFKYSQGTPELKQTKAKHRGIVSRIMERIRPERSIVQEQQPGKFDAAKQTRHQAMLSAEQEATQKALDVIQHALLHPEDATAQLGKNKAIEYLNRNKELTGKGSLQDWNRQMIAERWLKSDLSSVSGQADRKQKQLDQFNHNFGTDLTAMDWVTMDKLIASPAFQKQKELLGQQYQLVFEAVGDAVEQGKDPVRIEQTLELYTQIGADDYELFTNILDMDDADFTGFYEDAMIKIGEQQSGLEAYEVNQGLSNIFDKYK